MRSRGRRQAAALLALSLAACGRDPPPISVRNLERPSDMGFVCLRKVTLPGEGTVLTGRPMTDCHPHLSPDLPTETRKPVKPPNPREYGTFGLVTNTARGELAVVDLDENRLVDLDPTQPGYNMVPLGAFPEVVATSQDGCLAVTANRGSCDLSVVDPQRLMSPFFGRPRPATGDGRVALRVLPTTGSGVPLRVAPQEVAFLPQSLSDLRRAAGVGAAGAPPPPPLVCRAEGAVAGEARQAWRAVVTFPACDLVAVLELPSGRIVSSVHIRPEGVVDAGTEPVCPIDCGAGIVPQPAPDASRADVPPAGPEGGTADATDGSSSDAAAGAGASAPGADAAPGADGGASDGGAPVVASGPYRIGALAVRPEGNRIYVGGVNAAFVAAIDVVDGTLRAPAGGSRIILHDSPGGVTRLRLSVDPFAETNDKEISFDPLVIRKGKVGKYLGPNDSESAQYMYAFARDNSMRIIDVSFDELRGVRERECDMNVDPLLAPPTLASCQALPDDPAAPRPPRRALAQGPGLRIPTSFNPDSPPPVPLDISFARIQLLTSSMGDANTGDFGYVVASNQSVYVLNVASGMTNDPPPANSFRNENAHANAARPVVSSQPSRNFSFTDVPLPTRVTLTSIEGPRLEGIPTTDTLENRLATPMEPAKTWVWFNDRQRDPNGTSPQGWAVVWEGILPGTDRALGEVKGPGATPTGSAGAVQDLGAEFCEIGALPRDVVLLPGCLLDTDCLPAGTGVCRQTAPGTPGLCFPPAVAKDDALVTRCSRIIGSRRRYEVTRSTPRHLELGLKLDEVPKSSLDRCTTDEQCRVAPGFESATCEQVRAGEPRRCVKRCAQRGDDQMCRAGTVCEDIADSLVGPLCVEGPPILPECWPSGAPYRVQAGQSFLVAGSATPRPPTVREQRQGDERICVPDNARHPLLVNRIPLDAPHCANVEDETGPQRGANDSYSRLVINQNTVLPAAAPGAWGNPCLFKGRNSDETPVTDVLHTKALFRNQQLRFMLTNLETFAGDANLIRFDVSGGFVPDLARPRDDILFTVPVRMVTGPTATPQSPVSQPSMVKTYHPYYPYLYLIDQGRTGTASGGRGQILRLNPRVGGQNQLPFFDSSYSASPFQIQ